MRLIVSPYGEPREGHFLKTSINALRIYLSRSKHFTSEEINTRTNSKR